jgi:A/G-specific adenine glycosylase
VLEKEVPGVGRYTAGAIVSHAYNVPAELVDGNVIRVLSRLRAIGGDVKSPKVIDLHW